MTESNITLPSDATEARFGRTGIAESVLAEQVKLLYANLPVSQAVAMVNGVVLAIVQSSVIEAPQVLSWLACLVLTTICRGLLGFRFTRSAASVVMRVGGDTFLSVCSPLISLVPRRATRNPERAQCGKRGNVPPVPACLLAY